MSLYLSEHPDGVLILIRVVTRSSKIGPLGVVGTRLKWGINAAPVDGKANEALIVDIAKLLRCAKSSIAIIKGAQSKDKTILVQGKIISEINLSLT